MTERLWPLKDLARFLRYEDPEVRYWAADRLIRHHPEEATPLLAPYLFDEHDLTPEIVAVHLGRHGGPEHAAHLARGVRTLRGSAAARALEALVRLRAKGSVELVRDAFDRRDFNEESWSWILGALAERADEPAHDALRAFLDKRADWFGSPAMLRSALSIAQPGGYRPLLQAWIRSLQWRGAGSAGASGDDAGEAFRVLMDHLQIDDCGWCFRTTLSGRIDFHRTLKAVESAYDAELRAALGEPTCARIAAALEAGVYEASAAALSSEVQTRARAVTRAPGDDLVDRLVEVASFWADPGVARGVEGLGPHLQEWVIGFLLAAVIKMARYRNDELEVRRAGNDLAALLPMLEIESAHLIDALPEAIARAVEAAGPEDGPRRSAARRAVEERCLSILAMRGPFFPQVIALETLGALRSTGAISEIIDLLSEDNSYLYESAEHALSMMDAAVIAPVAARLEAGNLDEDSLHSLLVILSEVGSPEALRLVLEHFDAIVDAAGAGDAARWATLFGARELIPALRRHLKSDVPMVGQAMLLLGAIHNLRLPEEAEIRSALDAYWKESPEGEEGSGESGSGDDSGKYLM
jgi:DNA-binding transcriptional ArsR family regulator